MSQIKETSLERYRRLSRELSESWDKWWKEYQRKISEDIRKTIEKELDLMEEALKAGNLSEASYHKFVAECYFGLFK